MTDELVKYDLKNIIDHQFQITKIANLYKWYNQQWKDTSAISTRFWIKIDYNFVKIQKYFKQRLNEVLSRF